MLVLSRKKNQSIVLDGNISIEILQIKGNMIRLGINAPKSVRVLRGELKPFGMSAEESDDVVSDYSIEIHDSVVSKAS
ncbi:MAG: carbon storage regulator [Mariniblastus sp.]|nr:carbon storage regulator [Mariniblastus sp.]